MTHFQANGVVTRFPVWEVWISGKALYQGQLVDVRPHSQGRYPGQTFADACQKWADGTGFPDMFNRERLTFFGCPLYESEVAATLSYCRMAA